MQLRAGMKVYIKDFDDIIDSDSGVASYYATEKHKKLLQKHAGELCTVRTTWRNGTRCRLTSEDAPDFDLALMQFHANMLQTVAEHRRTAKNNTTSPTIEALFE